MKKIIMTTLVATMLRGIGEATSIPINNYPVVDSKCEINTFEQVICEGRRDAIFTLVDDTMDIVFAQADNDYPDHQTKLSYFATTSNRIGKLLSYTTEVQDMFIYEAVKYQIDTYLVEYELQNTNFDDICDLLPGFCSSIQEHTTIVGEESCEHGTQPVCGVKKVCTNYNCYQNTKTYDNHCHALHDDAAYIKAGLCDTAKANFVVEDIDYIPDYEKLGPGLIANVCNIGGDVFITHDDSFLTKFRIDNNDVYVPYQGGRFYEDECKEVFASVTDFDNLNKGLYSVAVEVDADDLVREENDNNNTRTKQIRLFDQTSFGSDLYIQSISYDTVEQNLLFEVCNDRDTFEGFLMLRVESANAIHDIVQNTILREEECDLYVSHIDDLRMRGGRNYYIQATIDPMDEVGESNEKNNQLRESMTLRDHRPDLYVADITETFVLSKHYANIKICNEKSKYEGDMTVRLTVNGRSHEVGIGISLNRLYPCVEYPFALEAFGINDGFAQGQYAMRAVIDPYDNIDEMYEQNNFYDKNVYAH